VDRLGRVVWSCLPRLDGDPVFHALVDGNGSADARGVFEIELSGLERSEQEYLPNTAILVTRLYSANGSAIEITDHCPRFERFGRIFRPQALIRRVRAWPARRASASGSGRPSNTARWRQRSRTAATTFDTSARNACCRLTTDAPVTYVLEETQFLLERSVQLRAGSRRGRWRTAPSKTARDSRSLTEAWWRQWDAPSRDSARVAGTP
jgi:hypothetical protein